VAPSWGKGRRNVKRKGELGESLFHVETGAPP
jgi:hypothetical protein